MQKAPKRAHRIRFSMWVSFVATAFGISVLFWVVLSTTYRMTYQSEIQENLERMAWSVMKKYGDADFENNLKLIAGSEDYFVQMITEPGNDVIMAYDNQGETSGPQAEGIIPEDIFTRLNETGGQYNFTVKDTVRDVEWAVKAMVVANVGGNRQVLILSKSMANIEYMQRLMTTRVLLALAVALLAASGISYLLTRKFAGPIGVLTEKAQLLAKGDYQVTFPKRGYYELEQLADTMEMAAREFQATEELRRDFIANISHDMKTPLTVIKMYAEMIQSISGDNPEKRQEHLEHILREAESLSEFINNSIDLARLQSKTWELKRAGFDIRHLIQSTVELFEIHKELEGFLIFVEAEEGLLAFADRNLISRVLNNLISNAIKFTADNKQIDVRAVKRHGRILVSVKDYGQGIAEEQLPYVWNRYYRVNPHEKNKSGTGLGLHIVKEIIELHGGNYGVESRQGQGSTFWFEVYAWEDRYT